MLQRNADTIYGAVLVLSACAMFVHTFSPSYNNEFLFGDVSTVFFPRLLLGATAIFATALMIKGLRSTSNSVLAGVNIQRILLTCGAIIVTTLGVWFFGYAYATPVGIFLIGLALGYPNRLTLLATSLISPLVVWLVLAEFAQVSFANGTIN